MTHLMHNVRAHQSPHAPLQGNHLHLIPSGILLHQVKGHQNRQPRPHLTRSNRQLALHDILSQIVFGSWR